MAIGGGAPTPKWDPHPPKMESQNGLDHHSHMARLPGGLPCAAAGGEQRDGSGISERQPSRSGLALEHTDNSLPRDLRASTCCQLMGVPY